jgi:hypothetical protein
MKIVSPSVPSPGIIGTYMNEGGCHENASTEMLAGKED